ncbi:TonB-linked outer membrane protein, SusC/RagA family [bacterium A37T11]|nr:TonB-linked outer membrane protein, SusC/RagA family [bacterium A37T11]
MIKKVTKWFVPPIFMHLVVVLLASTSVKGQGKTTVAGLVKSGAGELLTGVSVLAEQQGTSFKRMVTSNDQGMFVINNFPTGKGFRFTFTFIGFKKQVLADYAVNDGDKLSLVVTLDEEQAILDEVSVGYGAVRKKDITGSVTQVDIGEMQKQPALSLDVALVGRAAGVMVTKSSGAPGADASIRIRGASSVFGINEPLYVIDGVPIQIGQGMGDDEYRSSRSFQISPLASINPDDIERIDILKDASGTAIYGSRGANGVILVTTKKGVGGMKPAFTVAYNASVDDFVKDFNMLSSDEMVRVATQAYKNNGEELPSDFLVYPGVNTNWRKLVTRKSYSDTWNISLRGGSSNSQTIYAFSASTNNQKGVIKGSDFKRYNVRTNVESEVVKSLKVGGSVNYTKNLTNGLSNTYYYNIVTYRPDIPVFDPNGHYATTPDSVQANPVARTKYTNNLTNDNVLLSVFGEFRPIEALKLRSTISYNKTDNITIDYTPSYDPFEMRNGRKGSRDDINYNYSSVVFDNTATYDRFFGKHYLNAVIGASFTSDKVNKLNIESVNFPDDKVLNNLGSAGSIQSYESGGSLSGLESYFSRINYNYGGKYYVTFTARTDKSTKFGPNNQWGFFPSGALAWRASEEKFFKNKPWISDLKVRASYGKTGSANLGDFLYATFFSTGGSYSFHNGENGVTLNSVPNPSIKWETTTQADAGIDFAFFNNRLRGAVDVYRKYTSDLLLNVNIPYETGGSTQIKNVGDIANKGFELVIGGDVLQKKNFTYTSDINFSINHGRLEKLNGGASSSLNNFKEGDPLGSVFGYLTAGIFKSAEEIAVLNSASPNGFYQSSKTAPGDIKFIDQNKDGYISASDVVKLGNTEPKFFGGWNNVFRYKQLETSLLFYFSYGQKLYNGAKGNLEIYSSDKNYYHSILGAWTPENPSSNIPRIVRNDPNGNSRASDYLIQDGSFFKLKNLQIAYYLTPRSWTKDQVSQIKIFASTSNLFILTGYDGIDPEVSTSTGAGLTAGGYDSGSYPSTRTFSFGVNMTF